MAAPRHTLQWIRLERGTATVEAVVFLPVLLIVAFSVGYARSIYAKRLETLVEARRCAWTYAVNGCTTPPPGCVSVLNDVSIADPNDNLGSIEAEVEPLRQALVAAGSALSTLTEIPVLGDALEAMFGSAVSARVQGEVHRPKLYGPDKAFVSGSYYLACNERPRDAESVVRAVFEDVAMEYFP